MKPRQFTIRDLLLTTALIAVGAGLIAAIDKAEPETLGMAWLLYALWFVGGGLIGAGVFGLVRRPILGAAIGVAVQVLAALVYSFFS